MKSFLASVCVLTVSCALSCGSDYDCSLNGECSAGVCACVPPWTGSSCGTLDVLPAALPDAALYRRANVSSWCASTVRDDAGTWHAFISVFADHCGLNSWEANSELVHAVSAGGPAGPFVNDSVIRLPFAHNPKVIRDPMTGEYLIFHIGCGDNETRRYGPCAGGVTPPPPPPPAVRFVAAGGCLAPANGSFPAWISPQQRPISPVTLAVGAVCNSTASGWLVDRADNRLYSAAWPTAEAFIDCGACVAGNLLTLIGPAAETGGSGSVSSGGATSFIYNKSAGVIEISGCSGRGMCLSKGGAGAHQPCGAPGQPWSQTQLHVVPCDSADARGWVEEPAKVDGPATTLGPTCGGGFTEVLSAPSPEGPWTFQTAFGPRPASAWPFSTDNPSPYFWANGSIAVMYRSYAPNNSTIGIGRAEDWHGPWELPMSPVFYGHAEDPFIWYQNSTRSYHALLHGLGGCDGVGCHAFSADGFTWTLSAASAYNYTVYFVDGTNTTFARRERPHLVLDPDTGAPTHLINGVKLPSDLQPPGGQGDYSYSIIVPLRT